MDSRGGGGGSPRQRQTGRDGGGIDVLNKILRYLFSSLPVMLLLLQIGLAGERYWLWARAPTATWISLRAVCCYRYLCVCLLFSGFTARRLSCALSLRVLLLGFHLQQGVYQTLWSERLTISTFVIRSAAIYLYSRYSKDVHRTKWSTIITNLFPVYSSDTNYCRGYTRYYTTKTIQNTTYIRCVHYVPGSLCLLSVEWDLCYVNL